MIIGCDFDGTITAPYHIKSEELFKQGYKVSPQNTDRESCLSSGIDIGAYERATYNANVKRLIEIPLEKDAYDIISKINRKHSLIIITSREKNNREIVEKYLDFNEISYDEIFFTDNKDKSEIIKKVNCNLYIDDTLHKMINVDKSQTELFYFRNITNLKYSNTEIKNNGNWIDIQNFIESKGKSE